MKRRKKHTAVSCSYVETGREKRYDTTEFKHHIFVTGLKLRVSGRGGVFGLKRWQFWCVVKVWIAQLDTKFQPFHLSHDHLNTHTQHLVKLKSDQLSISLRLKGFVTRCTTWAPLTQLEVDFTEQVVNYKTSNTSGLLL